MTNPLKLYPPTIFILADLLCKAANLPMSFLPNFLAATYIFARVFYHLNFVLYSRQRVKCHDNNKISLGQI